MRDCEGVALIVEDDGTTRAAMSRLLRHEGIEVQSAASVAEGRGRLAASPPPTCLLVDASLPDGSGTEVVAAVRAAGLPAKVAIVTASVEPDRARRLKSECGADAVFVKPVDVVDVLRWVQGCCSGKPS